MPPVNPLISLHEFVRNALLLSSSARIAFLPIISREESSLHNSESFQPSLQLPTESESNSILGFIRDSFPTFKIRSSRYVATWADPSNAEAKNISIHGRIADSLVVASIAPESTQTAAIQFMIIVNCVHELAHAMRTHFHCVTHSRLKTAKPPYYVDEGLWEDYPEAGFLVEEALFGGVVCAVFKNEFNGQRPPFFELDFTNIDYFFLLCRNEAAYRIGMLCLHNTSHFLSNLYQ